MAHRLFFKSSFYLPLFFVVVLVFSLAQPAAAQAIVYGDTVPADARVDQNLILTGYNVTIDGTVNGDVLAIGTRVTINGTVNGSLFSAAEYINVNGQVTGNIYSAALLLNMGPASKLTRDLYFAGVQLNLQQDAVISRDLYTIALLSASFAGKVERHTYAEIGPSAILQMIFDLAGWPLPNWLGSGSLLPSPVLPRQAQVPSILASPKPVAFYGAGMHTPAWVEADGSLVLPGAAIDPEQLRDWGMDLLRNLVALLVVGLCMAWLLPTFTHKSCERLRMAPWAAVGWGLVVYLVGWFLFGLLFSLIIALAIFFFTVTFVSLGFLVGGVGLASLGLAFTLFVVSVFYASKIIVAFLIGRLLWRLASKKIAGRLVIPLISGVILYALLASVPYLGFVISTLATFFGMGALWMALRSARQALPELAAVEKKLEIAAPLDEPAVASLPEPEQQVFGDEALSKERNLKTTPLEEPPMAVLANAEPVASAVPPEEPPILEQAPEKPVRKRKKTLPDHG